MYVYRVTYNPAAGKNQEVTSLLKERVTERQSKGHRIFMMSEVLNPSGGFRHQLVSFRDNLNEWGDGWSQFMAQGPDPASAQYFQKIEPLLRTPVQSELWEVLVPIKTPPKAGEFVIRQSMYPLPTHGVEFRNSIIELTKQLQAQGWNSGAYAQFLPHSGAVLQFISPLARLGDWDALLARRTSEVFTWLRTYAALVRKPFEFESWIIVTEPPKA